MLSSYSQIKSLSYVAVDRVSAGGQAYLPVSPNQLIYAQFQYVSGVPSSNENEGVPVGKLQILNSLIDHMIRMQSLKPKNTKSLKEDEISNAQIDKLIQQYHKEMKKLDKLAEDIPYINKIENDGSVLNLTA